MTEHSDVDRWSEDASYHSNWDERTVELASLVSAGQTVVEFGSGPYGVRRFLPAGCEYVATDLILRGPGSHVVDLNATGPMPLPLGDVAFFSGVLEYIHDIEGALDQLSRRVSEVVCSYAPVELNPGDRRAHGWVNDHSADELIALFLASGFELQHRSRWKRQVLFRFARDPEAG